jgi:hypothetical protein
LLLVGEAVAEENLVRRPEAAEPEILFAPEAFSRGGAA